MRLGINDSIRLWRTRSMVAMRLKADRERLAMRKEYTAQDHGTSKAPSAKLREHRILMACERIEERAVLNNHRRWSPLWVAMMNHQNRQRVKEKVQLRLHVVGF